MYLVPEDGQYDQNIWLVLTGLIKFVVADDNTYANFNMIYQNGMNFPKIKNG
jgi:hypothetical protein